jgi:hypothetical protein
MLTKRLEHDSANQAAAAEKERKTQQRNEFCRVVLFQFQQTIIEPLVEFVDEFNRNYSGARAVASPIVNYSNASLQINMPSGKSLAINFYVLLEETFRRRVHQTDDFGRQFERVEIQMPHLKGRRIQGWGVVDASDHRGINLLLVEQSGQIYGDWFMLINTLGFFPSSTITQPEPFAFPVSELEQAVSLVGVLGQYQVKAEPLDDLAYLKHFIAEYV